jgi:hypothetical protein
MGDREAIPRRHGVDVQRQRESIWRLRLLVGREAEPTSLEWEAIGQSLRRGDEPMDRLVEWMVEEGLRRTRPLFDRAVAEGIDHVPSASPLLREFFAGVEARPAWVDDARLHEGARVCGISGLTGLDVLRDAGLLAGYQASAINRTLMLVGSLQKGAQRRVAETAKWWVDCTRPRGMARGAPGYQSTLNVRLMHALVRRRVAAMPEWDAAFYGLPINQGDMHATWLAFTVIFLLGQRLLGVPLRRDEAAAVMHLWRYIGGLMGVDERWLHESEARGRIALYQNLLSQAPPDESSRALGLALKDEPLDRAYPNLSFLRGRLNRAKHLSIARLFVNARGMRALGLPWYVLPWYPVLTAPLRRAWHELLRLRPAGREVLIRRGLAAQEDYLETLFGRHEPAIRSPDVHDREAPTS